MIEYELPGLYCFSKNKNSQYFQCSHNYVELAELHSTKSMLGKSDFDLCWRDNASFYHAIDQKILTEGLQYSNQLEILPLENRIATILVSKYPIYDNNGFCIGLSGYFTEVKKYHLSPKNGYWDKNNKRFYFDASSKDRYLTAREVDVLKLLMVGCCQKKTALALKISIRTVEEHIDNIKLKFNCYTKSEIVFHAFKMGLNHLILTIPGFFEANSW